MFRSVLKIIFVEFRFSYIVFILLKRFQMPVQERVEMHAINKQFRTTAPSTQVHIVSHFIF